jgi:hypothetical protein
LKHQGDFLVCMNIHGMNKVKLMLNTRLSLGDLHPNRLPSPHCLVAGCL